MEKTQKSPYTKLSIQTHLYNQASIYGRLLAIYLPTYLPIYVDVKTRTHPSIRPLACLPGAEKITPSCHAWLDKVDIIGGSGLEEREGIT